MSILSRNPHTLLRSYVNLSEIFDFTNKEVYATVVVHDRKDPRFNNAIFAEIEERIKKGTYEFVKESGIPPNATISQIQSCPQNQKFENADKYFKARLVVLGYIDPNKPRVVNEAPTDQKSFIRLAIALITSYGFHTLSREIYQAFLQREGPLRSTVYARQTKGKTF